MCLGHSTADAKHILWLVLLFQDFGTEGCFSVGEGEYVDGIGLVADVYLGVVGVVGSLVDFFAF